MPLNKQSKLNETIDLYLFVIKIWMSINGFSVASANKMLHNGILKTKFSNIFWYISFMANVYPLSLESLEYSFLCLDGRQQAICWISNTWISNESFLDWLSCLFFRFFLLFMII